jgi:hypothetical protein
MSVVSLKRQGDKGGDPHQVSLPHERQNSTRAMEQLRKLSTNVFHHWAREQEMMLITHNTGGTA